MASSLQDAACQSTLSYSAHIRYWRRCLKTFLPAHYTGNDANRMTLGFFILSALDLLGDLPGALSADERRGYIDWVYHGQLPEGGFRPAPATNLGSARSLDNETWDPAHVPGTFFALLTLAVLGDDLQRVKRREILLWLTKLQRPDGSFGETLGESGRIEGGKDTRFGYMVAAIRWILRGHLTGTVDGVPDIHVDRFVQCVRLAETYDGGISESPYHENHAGFASCAISALFFLDRLPLPKPDGRLRGITDLPMTLHWLVSRQTVALEEGDVVDTPMDHTDYSSAVCPDARSFVKLRSYPSAAAALSHETSVPAQRGPQWVGLNGRINKVGDTCYAYWVCSPLQILGYLHIIDRKPIRRWLLDRTQHMIGGFGKMPGDHPDIYHSFLGLMVLSMFGEAGLQDVDAALCVTNKCKQHLESLPWRRQLLGLEEAQNAPL